MGSVAAVLLLFVSVVWWGGKFFTGTMTLTAPGVSYSFGAAGLEGAECIYRGARIEHIYEPRAHISNSAHAEFLEKQLLAAREERANRRASILQGARLGYMSWRPAETEPAFNFTLEKTKMLAAQVATKFDSPCICYAFLGIAENIVYVRGPPEKVLYDPFIAGDDVKAVMVDYKSQFPLASMMESSHVWSTATKGPAGTAEPNTMVRSLMRTFDTGDRITVKDRGKISFINEMAQSAEYKFGDPVYPCIRYCLSFFAE
jgi:hypothetical protein